MWSVRCVYSENLLINVCYFKVVSLHNPELTTKFLSNITEAFILTSNLYNGKPWTFNELRNSVGCRLLFIFSVPSSLLTLSALYNVMIGVSYKNFLIPIELMSSQSEFQGVKIALSLSILSDDMWGETTFIKVSGVFGKLFGIKLSGIRMVFVVRQSNIQLTCSDYRRNSVKTRLRCSLLNCNYTLQVLQQVATND